ncbi:thiamine transporter 2-like [Astyanax mexicanus]|uniref:Thiamine transporter 2-like n=1 Tax=Astyanax mexicanus TaxID=7994 RepID=A0A8B9JKK7_ASTMX|nr:thiamine transporter 2-like [Astyanax mexicanus]
MGCMEQCRSSWVYPTSLLCFYGFFSTVKPLEPFLIPFLTGPDKNLTMEQVANQIFPVWTYSYLAVLVPVFLLTDWLRYKPVIVFQCGALFGTTSMLLWLQGVGVMQAMQFVYAVVTACDVAYFSYIYSMVALQHYLKATSYCRTAQLIGYTVGSVLGQLLVSFDLLSYHYILVLTLVLISVAMVTAVLLPMPKTSMFFHHGRRPGGGDLPESQVECSTSGSTLEAGKGGADEMETTGNVQRVEDAPQAKGDDSQEDHGKRVESSPASEERGGCCGTLLQLWRDFLTCYSSREMLYWSAWWALATCGYNQTINYVQALWEHVEPSSNFSIYNGGVEAVSSLFGAAAAYGISFSPVDWSRWGELALGSLSGLEGAALFAMVFSDNIWVCYAGYIIFKSLYMLLITIAMFQIAAGLSMERYALVFGVNTFAALVLQTVLTSIVVDSRGLGLDIVPQFIIYASYFSIIALLFLLRGLYTFYQQREPQHRRTAEEPSESVKQTDTHLH